MTHPVVLVEVVKRVKPVYSDHRLEQDFNSKLVCSGYSATVLAVPKIISGHNFLKITPLNLLFFGSAPL